MNGGEGRRDGQADKKACLPSGEASDGLIGPLFHGARPDPATLVLSQEQALVPASGDAKRRNMRVIFAHAAVASLQHCFCDVR
jgi:hypothetical protein